MFACSHCRSANLLSTRYAHLPCPVLSSPTLSGGRTCRPPPTFPGGRTSFWRAYVCVLAAVFSSYVSPARIVTVPPTLLSSLRPPSLVTFPRSHLTFCCCLVNPYHTVSSCRPPCPAAHLSRLGAQSASCSSSFPAMSPARIVLFRQPSPRYAHLPCPVHPFPRSHLTSLLLSSKPFSPPLVLPSFHPLSPPHPTIARPCHHTYILCPLFPHPVHPCHHTLLSCPVVPIPPTLANTPICSAHPSPSRRTLATTPTSPAPCSHPPTLANTPICSAHPCHPPFPHPAHPCQHTILPTFPSAPPFHHTHTSPCPCSHPAHPLPTTPPLLPRVPHPAHPCHHTPPLLPRVPIPPPFPHTHLSCPVFPAAQRTRGKAVSGFESCARGRS
ncbi:hypothetical protein C7M84_010107 [Penaeus vannamei]|uniref:Uncharacterized protein n=1 Tax=Penaeus vannamei TaxID=6689 RepID=A0A3R7SR73_PENVA|nr:hypothetical protein C7M84_010107 [Penaeus vannamei]